MLAVETTGFEITSQHIKTLLCYHYGGVIVIIIEQSYIGSGDTYSVILAFIFLNAVAVIQEEHCYVVQFAESPDGLSIVVSSISAI